MGFRKRRYIVLIFFSLFYVSIMGMQVIVEAPPKISILEKIFETVVASIPGIGIAYWGIRDNKKRDRKGIEIQWYNDIILEKIFPVINDYFNYLNDNVSELNNNNFEIEVEAKLKRMKLQGIVKLISIFDKNEIIQENLRTIIWKTQDIYRNNIPIIKISANLSETRKEMIKLLFNLKEELKI